MITETENPLETGKDQGKVGYKRPPIEHQFRPGHSGNPDGRPKFSLVSILKDQLQEVSDGEKEGKAKELVKKAIALAVKGDTNMLKDIINRVDGMPKQSLEHSGAEGEPIQLRIVNFKDSVKLK